MQVRDLIAEMLHETPERIERTRMPVEVWQVVPQSRGDVAELLGWLPSREQFEASC